MEEAALTTPRRAIGCSALEVRSILGVESEEEFSEMKRLSF
jgi:hypothetical protein